ncbi:MAG TPA: DUF4065 domain-containing protein [bacterium]|nr:DUF4065 domain-containing protein [bacterium]
MKTLLKFDYKKATQAINYFAKKEGGKIDKLKLIKLIYFADRYHLRKYGRPIMNDIYYAMRLGSVGTSVKDIAESSDFLSETEYNYAKEFISSKKENRIVSMADLDLDVFSKSDIEAFDYIYEKLGKYKASQLIDINHECPEWKKFKIRLESGEISREPMNYIDFFDNPKSIKYDFLETETERLKASKALFKEHYKVAKIWD